VAITRRRPEHDGRARDRAPRDRAHGGERSGAEGPEHAAVAERSDVLMPCDEALSRATGGAPAWRNAKRKPRSPGGPKDGMPPRRARPRILSSVKR